MSTRIAEVRQNVLRDNDVLARNLREQFADNGVFVVSLVSSPGAGKTSLLRETISALKGRWRCAALVGDLATDRDAARLRESGVPVRQITTGTVCHLDARMVESALAAWDLRTLDALFIENVGNLVCPASYDLGERMRVVLLSVTEGEDKPLKYPSIFNTADVVVITKIDLAAAVEFQRDEMLANLQSVRPGIEVFEVSAKSGAGIAVWLARLESARSTRYALNDD
ncbi:MAG TPA: hydrogenase nickel incorporation protein HypB [Gemmatimonadaceae bacterium]|nr:hydrogenase nickel incorporation protein HypB [Gemmatimonadaceae bacterium]